ANLGVLPLRNLVAHVGAEEELADRLRLVRFARDERQVIECVADLLVQQVKAEILAALWTRRFERIRKRALRRRPGGHDRQRDQADQEGSALTHAMDHETGFGSE